MEKKIIRKEKIVRTILIAMILTIFLFVSNGNIALAVVDAVTDNQQAIRTSSTQNDYVYLSDIPYDTAKSKAGHKEITLDKTTDNTTLSLKVEGTNAVFKKGVFAHATSTVVYDLEQYDYDYFTTYYGVSAHQGGNGSVKFYIYTSTDGNDWELETEENPPVMTGNSESKFVKIDIRGKKYLKLYADSNGDKGRDHSLYADSKLIKEGYNDNVTKTLEEYDELIKAKYEENKKVINNEVELLILQRELVKKAGNYQLRTLFEEGENYKETFNWLFNDLEMLRLYIMGGAPDGSYLESFKRLTELREKYGSDLTATGTSAKGTALSDIYKKMMISLSLSHSRQVDFWIWSTPPTGEEAPNPNPNVSIATNRYQIFKDLFAANKLDADFENLNVEEMRYIMGSQINDDEIKWLNNYASTKRNNLSGYSYMGYKNVNTALYRSEQFYADDISTYETKYQLNGFNVTNQKYYPRLWMIMEIGGVCWQISNVGQNAVTSMGIPSTIVGQPGHSAYFVRRTNANGDGYWEIWNNVGGWQNVNLAGYNGTRNYHTIRLLNGWGNGSYASSKPGAYILLGQAAMNDYTNYVKAKEKVLLANSYEGNKQEQETLYREALDIQSFNLDAWLGLINLYVNDNTKTEKDLYELAKEVAEALTYYPLPMHDMLRLINAKITAPAYMANMTSLETKTLKTATSATENEILQSDVVKIMANYLLGTLDSRIATFSFDGEEAKTISLASRYTSANSTWDYSLDGGTTWTIVDAHSKKLSNEEIALINANDDIKVHLIGVNYEEENIYTIDITEGTSPTGLYNNDSENKVIGATDTMEWRMVTEGETANEWKSFSSEHPDLTGDKTVEVRNAATGTKLAGEAIQLSFTQDVIDEKHTYISIDNLSVNSFSSETVRPNYNQHEYARNAIDGHLNTWWHSNRAATNDERFIVLELAEERYVSRLQYVPVPNYDYGIIKNAKIYTSLDGENWTEIKDVKDLPRDYTAKNIDFEPTQAKYVKLKVLNSYDYMMRNGADYFVSASMINLFEDTTKIVNPTADIEYSIKEFTNGDVVARLVNPSTEITITNNEGNNSYTFTENGEFTFEFEDKDGRKGRATAKVNWIDKDAPIATVSYEKDTLTNEDVTATISFNEEVTILNENLTLERQEDGTYTYQFEDNLGFCLEFRDAAGNIGKKEISVNWIDKIYPISLVSYNITETTDQDVIATITFSEEVTILNEDIQLNKQSDQVYTYTFKDNATICIEFQDKAGNIGEEELKVDWIKKASNEDIDGDIDGDGDITTNDLAMLKLFLIEKITFNQNQSKVADMDKDGEVTINDLALIKLMLIQ